MRKKQLIKICGLRTEEATLAALNAGADLIGFVAVPGVKRAIDPQGIAAIQERLRDGQDAGAAPCAVALTVNADDAALAELARIVDVLQFHGDEPPDLLAAVKAATGAKIVKAIGVAGPEDIACAGRYAGIVDGFIFDARHEGDGAQRGGLGKSFDWGLLDAYQGDAPFLLAGGLNPENVGEAIGALAAHPRFSGVDVSSGVEARPGEKSSELIAAFIKAAREAFAAGRG